MTTERPSRAIARWALSGLFIASIAGSPAEASVKRVGECTWKHLSGETRTAALGAGLVGGPAAVMSQVPRPQLLAAERVCGMTAANEAVFRRTEAGYILQLLAEEWFIRNSRITSLMLDRAWKAAGPDIKKPAKQWAIYLLIDPKVAESIYRSFAIRIAKPFWIGDDLMKPKMLTYIHGRALQDTYDAELN